MIRNENNKTKQEELLLNKTTAVTSQANTMSETTISKMKKRKIISLGKIGTGKSSIVKRFIDGTLPNRATSTFEENFTKNYFYKNEEWKLTIIDTAGQNEYTPAIPERLRIGAQGFILVFSINNSKSFEIIQHVNTLLVESIGMKYLPRILVGNKSDLDYEREVSVEKIKKVVKMWKCPYIECSAVNGGCEIEKVFYKLLKEIDKEENDEYPYNIRNSSLKMNCIRKNHKIFSLLLLIILGMLFVRIV